MILSFINVILNINPKLIINYNEINLPYYESPACVHGCGSESVYGKLLDLDMKKNGSHILISEYI